MGWDSNCASKGFELGWDSNCAETVISITTQIFSVSCSSGVKVFFFYFRFLIHKYIKPFYYLIYSVDLQSCRNEVLKYQLLSVTDRSLMNDQDSEQKMRLYSFGINYSKQLLMDLVSYEQKLEI